MIVGFAKGRVPFFAITVVAVDVLADNRNFWTMGIVLRALLSFHGRLKLSLKAYIHVVENALDI